MNAAIRVAVALDRELFMATYSAVYRTSAFEWNAPARRNVEVVLRVPSDMITDAVRDVVEAE